MKTNQDINQQIIYEASEWVILLDSGKLTVEKRERLAQWLLLSPIHIEEFLLASSVLLGLSQSEVGNTISIDIDALKSTQLNVMSIDNNVTKFEKHRLPLRRVSTLNRKWYALAASFFTVFLVYAAYVFNWPNNGPEQLVDNKNVWEINTKRGEKKSIALSDGTYVHINTDTHLYIELQEGKRFAKLSSGEAYFSVAKDSERPFIVETNDIAIQVVGTEFNVKSLRNIASVVVSEGVVRISSDLGKIKNIVSQDSSDLSFDGFERLDNGGLVLTVGEKADFELGNINPHLEQTSIDRSKAWLNNQVIFEDTLLSDITREFNRYNAKRIIVTDSSLLDLRFSGVFSADDPLSFAQFLMLTLNVKVTESEDSILISAS